MFAIIDAMHVLVIAGIIQCVAIRPIAQRTAFVVDGVLQHQRDGGMNAFPLWFGQSVATCAWVDAR